MFRFLLMVVLALVAMSSFAVTSEAAHGCGGSAGRWRPGRNMVERRRNGEGLFQANGPYRRHRANAVGSVSCGNQGKQYGRRFGRLRGC